MTQTLMCPGVSAGAEGTTAAADVVVVAGAGLPTGAPYCAEAYAGSNARVRAAVKIIVVVGQGGHSRKNLGGV